MPIKKYLDRVEHFDYLVRIHRTGPPLEVCRKLNLAPSTFYTFLSELKEDYGFPIGYCRVRKTYFYTESGKMVGLRYEKTTNN